MDVIKSESQEFSGPGMDAMNVTATGNTSEPEPTVEPGAQDAVIKEAVQTIEKQVDQAAINLIATAAQHVKKLLEEHVPKIMFDGHTHIQGIAQHLSDWLGNANIFLHNNLQKPEDKK